MKKTRKKPSLAFDTSIEPTPVEKKKILKARAKILAREPEREEKAEAYLEVVEFVLAYEKYAIETAYIR